MQTPNSAHTDTHSNKCKNIVYICRDIKAAATTDRQRIKYVKTPKTCKAWYCTTARLSEIFA